MSQIKTFYKGPNPNGTSLDEALSNIKRSGESFGVEFKEGHYYFFYGQEGYSVKEDSYEEGHIISLKNKKEFLSKVSKLFTLRKDIIEEEFSNTSFDEFSSLDSEEAKAGEYTDIDDISEESESSLLDDVEDMVYEEQLVELRENLKENKNYFDKYTSLEPREYQKEAIRDTTQDLFDSYKKNGKGKGMIVLPTGFGKTFISSKIAKNLKDKLGKEPFRVLFLVHKNDIVLQTANLYKDGNKGPFTNYFGHDKVGVYIGGKKKYQKGIDNIFTGEKNDVVVANISSLYGNLDKFDKDSFDLIIADECHRAVGRTYQACIDHFNYKFLLGVTATPSREGNKDGRSTDYLLRFFGNNTIYEKHLLDSIKNGHLATPLYYIRTKEKDLEELQTDIKSQIVLGKSSSKKLKTKKRYLDNFDILDSDIDLLHKEKRKTVVFCENIDIAEEIYHKISNKGYPAQRMFFRPDRFDENGKQISFKVGETKITPTIFMKKIDDFKKNDHGFLVVVDLFTEGTDIPEIDSLMLLRPTTSNRIYFQILGRGLRKNEKKDTCLVFDYNFETMKLDLLREKINLFDTVSEKSRTSELSQRNGLSNDTILKLKDTISEFESDGTERNKFKAKFKSRLFKEDILPEQVDNLFGIITSDNSDFEKKGEILEYKHLNKLLFDFEGGNNEKVKAFLDKFLSFTNKEEFETFLFSLNTTTQNKLIPEIPSTDQIELSESQKEKLNKILEDKQHVGHNYSIEYKEIGGKKYVCVRYRDKKGEDTFNILT